MFSTEEACRKRVYTATKKGRLKKVGRVRAVVFHPSRAEVVGYIVKRPDLLLMFKRGDRFVAADSLELTEDGFVAPEEPGVWGREACRRLDIDYDLCLLWVGMPVVNETGRELGTVKCVFFDGATRRVDHIDISVDSVARTLLGESEIARDAIVGFKDGALVVTSAVTQVEESGGVAAAAGEAWAKAKHSAAQRADKAEKAIDNGAYKVGEVLGAARQKVTASAGESAAAKTANAENEEPTQADKAAQAVGRQIGKFPSMFKDFKDEFDKASRGE